MTAPPASREAGSYPAQLVAWITMAVAGLARPANAPYRAQATRRVRMQSLGLVGIGTVLTVLLMVGVDAWEISLMPPRGAPSLWPARVVTDFGKDSYVMIFLGVILVATVFALPMARSAWRERMPRLAGHLAYLFVAVVLSNLAAEIVKYAVGRGRPFVGGQANPFNFAPFAGHEPYFSLPSAHAATAFALAFGVAAIWPRLRIPMLIYALAVAASRLVILAHHPSDVVAGAVIGLLCALMLRYWCAARHLGFAIEPDGKIVAC